MRLEKEEFVETLREHIKAGGGLRKEDFEVSAEMRNLRRACFIYFGSVYKAVVGIGLNPKDYNLKRMTSKWDKEKIKSHIIERLEQGEPINVNAIIKDHRGLAEAIRNYFWTWEDALIYSGINPDEHRLMEEWSKDKLINYIQNKYKNYSKERDGAFWFTIEDKVRKAATSYFGGFKNLVEASGIEYKDVVTYTIWDEETVRSRILERYNAGLPMGAKATIKSNSALYSGALSFCGDWDTALTLAGLDPTKIRYGTKRTKENLKEELLKLYNSGSPINGKHMTENYPTLFSALNDHFGNYENAVTYCGLDYTTINQKSHLYSWDKDKILEELQYRNECGLPMHPVHVHRDFPELYHACNSIIGTYSNILDSLGISLDGASYRGSGLITYGVDGNRYDSSVEAHCADAIAEAYLYGIVEEYEAHPKVPFSNYKADFMIVMYDGRVFWVEVDGMQEARSDGPYIRYKRNQKGIMSPIYSDKIKHYLENDFELLIAYNRTDLQGFLMEYPNEVDNYIITKKDLEREYIPLDTF